MRNRSQKLQGIGVICVVILGIYIGICSRNVGMEISATLNPADTTDTDEDGMTDWWETQYGLNPADPADAEGDMNGDGQTNLEMYQAELLSSDRPTIVIDSTIRPETGFITKFTETPLTVPYTLNGVNLSQDFDLTVGYNTLIIEAWSAAGMRKIASVTVEYDDGSFAETCRTNSDPLGLADGTSVLFVDKNNCNCSDAGSPVASTRERALNPETPFCTVAKLREYNGPYDPDDPESTVGLFHPGDTVYIRGGDYQNGNASIHIWSSGTAEAPITIRPYPNEDVTIRLASSASYAWNFVLQGDYIVLDGLELIANKETSAGTLYAPLTVAGNGNNLQFKNMIIHGNQGYLDDIGHGQRELDDGTEYGRLLALDGTDGTLVEDTSIICGEADENYEKEVSPTVEGLMCNECTNVTMNRVTVNRCGHQAMQIKYSSNVLIENSDIQNEYHTALGTWRTTDSIVRNNRIHNWNNTSDVAVAGNAIQLQASSRFKIYNNLFYDGQWEGQGISIGGEIDGDGWRTDDNEIYNNTFYDMGVGGIQISHYSGGASEESGNRISGNKIFNNIIYGVGFDGIYYEQMRNPFAFGFLNRTTVGNYDNEFYNNIFHNFDGFAGGTGQIAGERFDPTQVHLEYTIDELNALSFAWGNIDADPLYTDPENADFTPQSGSVAIGGTTCPEDLTTDYLGNTRDPDNCTIGAIEVEAPADEGEGDESSSSSSSEETEGTVTATGGGGGRRGLGAFASTEDGLHGAADHPPIDVPIDEKGFPISQNEIWNACIRETIVVVEGIKPLNCRRYHHERIWQHPDLGIYFVMDYNEGGTPKITLPTGYATATVSQEPTTVENTETMNTMKAAAPEETILEPKSILETKLAELQKILQMEEEVLSVKQWTQRTRDLLSDFLRSIEPTDENGM